MSMKIAQSESENEQLTMSIDEWAHEWRRSQPRYTDKELIEIFSPPPDMIQATLKEIGIECDAKTDEIKGALRRVYATDTDEFSHWFGEAIVKTLLFPKLEQCNKHLFRLKRLLTILSPKNSMANTKQEALEKARQYPIFEITKYRLALQPCGNKSSSLCPFHEEKHASFYIYHATNTFHCFGCQESGDVIKITMHLYSVSFKEAVQMLQ